MRERKRTNLDRLFRSLPAVLITPAPYARPMKLSSLVCTALAVSLAPAPAAADQPVSDVALIVGVHHYDVPIVGLRYARTVASGVRVTVGASTFFRLADRVQVGAQWLPLGSDQRLRPYLFARAGALYRCDDGAGFDDSLAPLGTAGAGLAVSLHARVAAWLDYGADVVGPDYAGENDRDEDWRIEPTGVVRAGVAVHF